MSATLAGNTTLKNIRKCYIYLVGIDTVQPIYIVQYDESRNMLADTFLLKFYSIWYWNSLNGINTSKWSLRIEPPNEQ